MAERLWIGCLACIARALEARGLRIGESAFRSGAAPSSSRVFVFVAIASARVRALVNSYAEASIRQSITRRNSPHPDFYPPQSSSPGSSARSHRLPPEVVHVQTAFRYASQRGRPHDPFRSNPPPRRRGARSCRSAARTPGTKLGSEPFRRSFFRADRVRWHRRTGQATSTGKSVTTRARPSLSHSTLRSR